MEALEPVGSLSMDDRRKSLTYLIYLKMKFDRNIMGRGCADGHKQRIYMKKGEATSSTVSVEAVFLTSVSDALEGRMQP